MQEETHQFHDPSAPTKLRVDPSLENLVIHLYGLGVRPTRILWHIQDCQRQGELLGSAATSSTSLAPPASAQDFIQQCANSRWHVSCVVWRTSC